MANNWTNEQKQAILLQDKNILVSASAGSGKTAVLVQRVIEKVIKYKIDIDKIMVVTFTNAAASELRERLNKALVENLKKDPSNLFIKRQLSLVKRANISTMDSFCMNLVKSNFSILGLDPNFSIASNADLVIFKSNAIEEVLEKIYKDEAKSHDMYKLLELFGGSDEKLTNLILNLYGYIQSFPYPLKELKKWIEKYNIEYTDKMDLKETEFGKEIMDDVISSFKIIISKEEILRKEVEKEEGFEKFISLIDDDISYLKRCTLNSNTFDRLYELLNFEKIGDNLRNKVENTELKDKIKDFRTNILKKEINNSIKSIYADSRRILEDNKIAYWYLEKIYELVEKFDSIFTRIKKENNILEFDDVRHNAINLLYDENDDFSSIALEYQNDFVEVYTDEYQDTNYVQEKILVAVSGNKNRFMVGDIKQSIYKFIQARPELFNEKYDSYNKDESDENVKIILAENFRSKKSVLDSINYIFTKIMTKELGECAYEGVETLKNGATWYMDYENQNYATDFEIVDLNKEEISKNFDETQDEVLKDLIEKERFEKEAICIARKIKNLKENFMINDTKNKSFRKCKYSDIVVLSRSISSKGVILEKVLKQEGIPCFCDGTSNIFLSDEVKLVISFLKVLDNPYQDVDLIAVMYSVVGNFSLDEITKIKNETMIKKVNMFDLLLMYKEKKEEVENLSDEEKVILEKVNKFLNLYFEFRNYCSYCNISEVIQKMYNNTNIMYQYYFSDMSDTKLSNLNLIITYAREFESSKKSTSILDFINYIDKVKNVSNAMSGARVIGENEDVVRIMTIHKSKGLEFPIVILCDTTGKYNERDFQNEIIFHHKLGIGINIVKEDFNISYPSIIKKAIKLKGIKENRSEELRMLYVALTRAKEKLVIFATLDNYEKFSKNQFVMYDDKNRIDPMIVAKNNNYFANIQMALKNYDENLGLFNINVTKIDDVVLNNEKIDEENVENNKNITSNDTNNMLFVDKIYEKIKKLNISIDEKSLNDTYNKINENLNYKYKNIEDTISKTRVSVSSLKQEYLEDENVEKKEYNVEIPKCIDENIANYSSTRKGTLIHYILEILDFGKINTIEDLKENINELVKNKTITLDDKKQINVNKIFEFINSSIGSRLKKAKSIQKEEEFILIDEKYSKSPIQGIIDLYFVDEYGNYVLIDFKTDRMYKEDDFIKKYKIQLDIYKSAIEKIKNVKVEEVYIYSFEMGKEIKID